MFGLQREGTLLKGRGRSQCGQHGNEEAQVAQGLTVCPAVTLSDPQSTRSAGQAGRWRCIQSLPFALCEKANYRNINHNSQKSRCDCSGRGAPNIDEEGESWRNWLLIKFQKQI